MKASLLFPRPQESSYFNLDINYHSHLDIRLSFLCTDHARCTDKPKVKARGKCSSICLFFVLTDIFKKQQVCFGLKFCNANQQQYGSGHEKLIYLDLATTNKQKKKKKVFRNVDYSNSDSHF